MSEININIEITKRTNDGGLDFRGSIPFKSGYTKNSLTYIEIYGQAKKWSVKIDRPTINTFTGFANDFKRSHDFPAQLFIICTTSDFFDNAMKAITNNHFIGLNGMQISTLIFNYLKNIEYTGSDYIVKFME